MICNAFGEQRDWHRPRGRRLATSEIGARWTLPLEPTSDAAGSPQTCVRLHGQRDLRLEIRDLLEPLVFLQQAARSVLAYIPVALFGKSQLAHRPSANLRNGGR